MRRRTLSEIASSSCGPMGIATLMAGLTTCAPHTNRPDASAWPGPASARASVCRLPSRGAHPWQVSAGVMPHASIAQADTTAFSRRLDAGNGHSAGAMVEIDTHSTPYRDLQDDVSYIHSQLDTFRGPAVVSHPLAAGGPYGGSSHPGPVVPSSPYFQMHASSFHRFSEPLVPGSFQARGDISFQSTRFADGNENARVRPFPRPDINALVARAATNDRRTFTGTVRTAPRRRDPGALDGFPGPRTSGGHVAIDSSVAFTDHGAIYAMAEPAF